MANEKSSAMVRRDVAILLLFIWMLVQVLVMAIIPKELRVECFIFIFCMSGIVMMGYLGNSSIALVLACLMTSIWVGYKLYLSVIMGNVLVLTDYLLIPMPLIGIVSALLYERGKRGVDSENELLRKQVEDTVLVDEVTQMYNLRALLRDARIMVFYGKRNNLPVSIMIIQMRYESELRGMLNQRDYTTLLRQFANVVQNSVRVEDRVYCIDEHGTLAILLTSAENNAGVVKTRILASLKETNAFEGILDQKSYLAVRIAFKGYKDEYGEDMVRFKREAESELAYDV